MRFASSQVSRRGRNHHDDDNHHIGSNSRAKNCREQSLRLQGSPASYAFFFAER
jgi:hypothetical protein